MSAAFISDVHDPMARSVITDVAKLDVVSDGLLHNQLLHFCQTALMAFLGRNTPTPLLSEFMAQVDGTPPC